jgi:hypothetical protein
MEEWMSWTETQSLYALRDLSFNSQEVQEPFETLWMHPRAASFFFLRVTYICGVAYIFSETCILPDVLIIFQDFSSMC